MCKHPITELISVSRSLHGGWKVVVLINENYYQTYHYFGYTKAEAKRLAKADALKEASQYFYCE